MPKNSRSWITGSILLLILQWFCLQASVAGNLTGTVTDVATGDPIPNVYVYVYDIAGWRVTDASTDANGSYTTSTVLTTGTYFAATSSTVGYVDELHDNIPCVGYCSPTAGTPIAVTEGAMTTIDFALSVGSAISGTITDAATGAPIPDIYLFIWDSSENWATYTWTDALGSYISPNELTTDTYFVEAFGQGYISEIYDNIHSDNDWDLQAGTLVSVTQGVTTGNIDFALVQTPLFDISASTLDFGGIKAVSQTLTQSVTLTHTAGGTFHWSVSDNAGWLSVLPAAGDLEPGDVTTLTVSVDTTGFPDEASAAITLVTPDGPLVIPVDLTLYANEGQRAFFTREIVAADEFYKDRLVADPEDQEANFFRAVTRILRLLEENQEGSDPTTFTDSLKEMLDRFGASPEGRSLFDFTASLPDILPLNAPRGVDVQTYVETMLLPEIIGAVDNLRQINEGFELVIVRTALKSIGFPNMDAVELDFGDAKLYQASLSALQGALHGFVLAYDWDVNLHDLSALDPLRLQQDVLDLYPQLLTLLPGASSQLAMARTAIREAVDAYFSASDFIRNRDDENQNDDLVSIAPEDLEEELDFRTVLGEMRCSLDGVPLQTVTDTQPVCAGSGTPEIDGVTANAGRFVDNPSDLHGQLPAFGFDTECGRNFIDTSVVTATSPFPDPTFNGALPGMTQNELLDLLHLGPDIQTMGSFEFYPLQASPGTTARGFAAVMGSADGLIPQPSLKVSGISLQDGTVFSLDGLPATFPGSPIVLCGAGESYFEVVFSPSAKAGEGGYTDTLIIESNDPRQPRLEIPIKGCTGSPDDCDNDGVPDSQDACSLDTSGSVNNSDGDDLCDGRDPDDDNDGVLDSQDAFPLDPNEWLDTDRDGIGDNADPDDDNDGMTDEEELARGRNPLLNEGIVIPLIQSILSD